MLGKRASGLCVQVAGSSLVTPPSPPPPLPSQVVHAFQQQISEVRLCACVRCLHTVGHDEPDSHSLHAGVLRLCRCLPTHLPARHRR